MYPYSGRSGVLHSIFLAAALEVLSLMGNEDSGDPNLSRAEAKIADAVSERLREDLHGLSLNGERETLREIASHLPALAETAKLAPYVPDIITAVERWRVRNAFGKELRRLSLWDRGTRTIVFYAIAATFTAISGVVVWHFLGGPSPGGGLSS